MKRSTIFKLTFWILVCAQLGGLIFVWTLARSITDSENQDRGLFSYQRLTQIMSKQWKAINTRRGLPDPIGDIGSGITKVVSVAAEVPAAVKTAVADILSFELDAGTRQVSVQIASETITIWPPSGAKEVPDLPTEQQGPIKNIIKIFNKALSFNLGTIVGLMIVVAILSTCAVVGLGIELHLCRGMVAWCTLVSMGIIASLGACFCFWYLYHILDVIVSAARQELRTVDRGPAIDKAWYTFLVSALQGSVSILLCGLSVAHKIRSRQRKPSEKDTKGSEFDVTSPPMAQNTCKTAPAGTQYETIEKPESTHSGTVSGYWVGQTLEDKRMSK